MNFSEETLISNFLFPNDISTLVDVGAHQGSFLREFANKGWNIIAFEAERTNYSILKDKFANFDNVVCIQKAVYDTSELEIPFYTSKKHFGIHSLKPFHKTHEQTYNVETTRLDDALNDLDVKSVELLKIDIEGADFLALKSFDFTKYKPELIMIEFMDSRSLSNYSYSHHDVVKYMNRWDYTCYVSEWEPIEEYGIEGEISAHKWIQCIKYPLDHEPSWGNLIFVDNDSKETFDIALSNYLYRIEHPGYFYKLNQDFIRPLQQLIINKLRTLKISK